MQLTRDQLLKIMPKCPKEDAAEYANTLGTVMEIKGKIYTVNRAACFLGQLALESGELRYWTELSDGSLYEGRKDLGNTEPGDGPRFRGRGPIQLTGRANYQAFADWSGYNGIITNPELLASDPELGFLSAVWYWDSRNLNDLADRMNIKRITRKINGGLTHLDRRERYTERAVRVLSSTARLR